MARLRHEEYLERVVLPDPAEVLVLERAQFRAGPGQARADVERVPRVREPHPDPLRRGRGRVVLLREIGKGLGALPAGVIEQAVDRRRRLDERRNRGGTFGDRDFLPRLRWLRRELQATVSGQRGRAKERVQRRNDWQILHVVSLGRGSRDYE